MLKIVIFLLGLSYIYCFETVIQNFDNTLVQGKSPRIVNGQTAQANQFPHQVVLTIKLQNGNALCGGSLINSGWVLSAAHCIIGAKGITVQLGSNNRASMPIQRIALQALRLKTYNPFTLADDISLIKLNSPVVSSINVMPIALPADDDSSLNGEVLRVSGFGLTELGQISSTLRFTDVKGISLSECQSYYGTMITDKIVCTRGYPSETSGTCNGDSGGPLISLDQSVQIGIVSFGSAQGCEIGAPQGFTRVSKYLTWINSMIKT